VGRLIGSPGDSATPAAYLLIVKGRSRLSNSQCPVEGSSRAFNRLLSVISLPIHHESHPTLRSAVVRCPSL